MCISIVAMCLQSVYIYISFLQFHTATFKDLWNILKFYHEKKNTHQAGKKPLQRYRQLSQQGYNVTGSCTFVHSTTKLCHLKLLITFTNVTWTSLSKLDPLDGLAATPKIMYQSHFKFATKHRCSVVVNGIMSKSCIAILEGPAGQ